MPHFETPCFQMGTRVTIATGHSPGELGDLSLGCTHEAGTSKSSDKVILFSLMKAEQ